MINCVIAISIIGVAILFTLFILIKNLKNVNNKTMSDYEMLRYNVDLLDFINITIDIEISKFFKESIHIREKYMFMNFDTDISKISQKIIFGFSKKIITNPNNVYTSEYLISYIVNQSFIKFLEFANTYNTYIEEDSGTI